MGSITTETTNHRNWWRQARPTSRPLTSLAPVTRIATPQTPYKYMKKNYRILALCMLWSLSIVVAFVGGVCYTTAFYVPSCRFRQIHVIESSGPGPSLEALRNANIDVEEHLAHSAQRTATYSPQVIVAPELDGYIIYYSSGSIARAFPDALLASSVKVIRESLEKSTGRTKHASE